jgi:hypothetical protein
MNEPNILHPMKTFVYGVRYKVFTYFPITDAQAMKIAMRAYNEKQKGPNRKSRQPVEIRWMGDRDVTAML